MNNIMHPVQINDKWWIQVTSKSLGTCFLLDKNYPDIPMPIQFNTEREAVAHIQTLDLSKYEDL